MVFFNGVTKVYEKTNTTALSNVNFYIDKGEFVFIIGSSGAGKSTLTKLILGEEKPTEGEIIINNIDVVNLEHREIPYYRRKIGMVFQDFRLLNGKSVYENVAFAMHIKNASSKEIRRVVPNVLSTVGLSHKADAMPYELSGGEQQRVAIARAIVNDPAVLIADEPTGNLDPSTADEIMQILDDINKRGTTVIVVSHAKDIVDKMKKRVIELEFGTMVRDEEGGAYTYES